MPAIHDDPPLKPIIENPHGAPPKSDRLEHLAWLMDRAIKVPGTPITIGLDAILGLLPVGGDFLTGVIQTGIVLVSMYHYRVPKAIAARMAANVLLDTVVGSIPFVGDAFDVFFKANTRNMQLLKTVQHQRVHNQPVATAPSVAWLGLVALVLIGTLLLVLVGFVSVVAWLFRRPLV